MACTVRVTSTCSHGVAVAELLVITAIAAGVALACIPVEE